MTETTPAPTLRSLLLGYVPGPKAVAILNDPSLLLAPMATGIKAVWKPTGQTLAILPVAVGKLAQEPNTSGWASVEKMVVKLIDKLAGAQEFGGTQTSPVKNLMDPLPKLDPAGAVPIPADPVNPPDETPMTPPEGAQMTEPIQMAVKGYEIGIGVTELSSTMRRAVVSYVLMQKDKQMLSSIPTVPLKDAEALYQPVTGTSNGSRYFVIGMSGPGPKQVKVAMRRNGSTCSVRIEGNDLPGVMSAIKQGGFLTDQKNGYASVHLDGAGTVFDMRRVLGAVLATMAPQIVTPLPDFDFLWTL
jgi:hypothetical protein